MKTVKKIGWWTARILGFIIGFAICQATITLGLMVEADMEIFEAIGGAAFPSLLFGLWCSHVAKEDLEP